MRHDELGRIDDELAVQEDVDVEGARPLAALPRPVAPEARLDGLGPGQ